ncbi:SIR2 family protein [Burkholderia thailandensis]|uniref:SIR2 family protein n=1 Tax=Burkholderia thailandensis TaxID=57975 RepID=UPI001376A65B|nr:SIR2 family protein [Burkholderia thailandensis]MCS6514798.1 SIR2 family protein [Burkholderia thailandensis]NBD07115.1 hypothetical protein [Burkholderia thailandensis]
MANESFAVHKLSEDSGRDFLRGLLLTGRCIPFLGAGFTMGEKAHKGTVPSGRDFEVIMRNAISTAAVSEKPSEDSLKKYDFQQLADEYFREPIVDIDAIKTTLLNHFTNVSISSEAKKAFLKWDWEYFYTLNIDDAIERELNAIKVLPFTDFSQHKTTQFVYKLHGDAADAVTAASRETFRLVFGSVDYIKSLITNRALLSALTNDLAERHLLFVGCSLSDELDILFSLSGHTISNNGLPATSRVYVTGSEPVDYEDKKKLRRYGITDVLVVDYADFYAFVGSVPNPNALSKSPLSTYAYSDSTRKGADNKDFLRYLLQISWRAHDNPGASAIPRDKLTQIEPLLSEPIVVLYGRRFSGRTSMLFAILRAHTNRRRFAVLSSAAASDAVMNDIVRTKDALIAIDSDAVSYQQLQMLVRKIDQVRDNNTTLLLAMNRGWLTALGPQIAQFAIEVEERMSLAEANKINSHLDEFGFSKKWEKSEKHLDNIFSLSESPVVKKLFKQRSRLHENIERLQRQWSQTSVGHLEFSLLFYLGTRQRIYSRYFRELAKDMGLSHLSNTHFEDFARQWQPFVELEDSDASSMRSEKSASVIVANASAWIHYALHRIAKKLGPTETAAQIVRTFRMMKNIEEKAFELLLFDNLNLIFAEDLSFRSAAIREIYESLATYLANDPDYWLQRAKSIYYLSNNVDDLLVGAEYCEKSIVKKAVKTNTNAKLTKANLLGKICKVKKEPRDSDLISAIDAYITAIESRAENPVYIDDLLRKSKTGKGYMSLVCRLARKRVSLLPQKHDIELIEAYVSGRY